MKETFNYFDFSRKHGRKLSEINPGSDEIALTTEEALCALQLLDNSHIPILGGDILSEKNNGELIYAYQLWGDEYQFLNWSCDKEDNESKEEYIKRSHISAKENIKVANDIAVSLDKKCYVVIVI